MKVKPAKDGHLVNGFGWLPARPLLRALVEHVNTSYTVPFDVLTLILTFIFDTD